MNHWTDASLFDRAEEQRADPGWTPAQWSSPDARLLVVGPNGELPVTEAGQALRLDPPAGRFDPDRHWLIGLSATGPVFAASGTTGAPNATLREVGHLLDDQQVELATTAVALANWHRASGFCARCGGITNVRAGGVVRRCDTCARDLFPRTDPAVIVAVLDPDDRLLLARQPVWPEGRRSLLAGFVSAGESLEQAVRREVAEESGVVVDQVAYLASQPWPSPRSLMVGFVATTRSVEIRVDGVEIVEADWFSRDELTAAVAAGTLSLPMRSSIAHRIITSWREGRLPARDG